MNIKKYKVTDILNNIIATGITFISASIMFDLKFTNQLATLFFIISIGMANYFLKEIQAMSILYDYNRRLSVLIEQMIILEKTVSELQVLCTDEDVLERCRAEASRELEEIREYLLEK